MAGLIPSWSVNRGPYRGAFHPLTLIIQVSHTPRHVTPVQPEYWENPPFTGQVNPYTGPGQETPIAVFPGQGANIVYSTYPPNPHP